jgi:electron transport complex protein RnfA
MLKEIFIIIIGAVFVNNFVFSRFLGQCPFLGVSNKTETAVGMGMATTFVLTLTAIAAYFIQTYILGTLWACSLFANRIVYTCNCISCTTCRDDRILKISPALYNAFGIFLPLITTNCIVLGVALLIPTQQL